MKKIIILLILAIIVTGCSRRYAKGRIDGNLTPEQGYRAYSNTFKNSWGAISNLHDNIQKYDGNISRAQVATINQRIMLFMYIEHKQKWRNFDFSKDFDEVEYDKFAKKNKEVLYVPY